ncbi:conserved hypothetical protein [Tenacibaculum litopenaei]|uniref:DUF58 domain-containing protein n=1 Tax=Tenacibaculum litopenaei TaxID=396016 RepID=UPI0038938333
MQNLYNSLFLNNRFFYGVGMLSMLFIVGYFVPFFFWIAKLGVFFLVLLTLVDMLLLFSTKNALQLERILPERLSNGDDNTVQLHLTSKYKFKVKAEILEELPFQFQLHNFSLTESLTRNKTVQIDYIVSPKKRGEYNFGRVNIFITTPFQLASKKFELGTEKTLKCYPSFLKIQDFSLKAISNNLTAIGSRKIRRLGHSLEFEQIKEYVSGDDIRTLNWKATAKRNQLMVNQYIDEKSQPVYAIIDKGRTMQMDFDKLHLLDYAINATLALSNIILSKQDKAGMLTFAESVDNFVVAEQRRSQMNLISDALYNVKTKFIEADYSLLYATIKRKITSRSLLLLYTNFETIDALNRQLPYLRAIAKNHLLIVIFFENTELINFTEQKAKTDSDVYDKVIAEKFMYEKKQIANELRKYGIQSVLSTPGNLTGNTINKYLEIKSRGLH